METNIYQIVSFNATLTKEPRNGNFHNAKKVYINKEGLKTAIEI
jgi:hypothetical protein